MDSQENKTVSLGTIHLCIMYGVPRHYTLSTKKASAIYPFMFYCSPAGICPQKPFTDDQMTAR